MFRGCSSLSDINILYKWNVSNGNNFNNMFLGCSSLSNINGLQNWNVLYGNNFRGMFKECPLLLPVSKLKSFLNWNLSDRKYKEMIDCSKSEFIRENI